MEKRRISSELVYVSGAVILSFATAMLTAANLGLSMVVAPAYIVSLKVDFLTFGQAEYLVQGLVFLLFCIIVKKVKGWYFFAFLSGVIYGLVLDLWMMMIPHFNPELFKPGSFPVWLRLLYFAVGFFLNSLGVMLYFKAYLYPQVYEFFVKGVSQHLGIELTKFKIGFDMTCLVIAVVLSMLLLHRIEGIGPGTVVLAFCNGMLIRFLEKCFDKHFDTFPRWRSFSEKFDM